jgi:hypothetical protein
MYLLAGEKNIVVCCDLFIPHLQLVNLLLQLHVTTLQISKKRYVESVLCRNIAVVLIMCFHFK